MIDAISSLKLSATLLPIKKATVSILSEFKFGISKVRPLKAGYISDNEILMVCQSSVVLNDAI